MSFIDECEELKLPLHGVRLPEFKIDPKHKQALNLPDDVSNFDFLRAVCLNGFRKLKLPKNSPEYETYASRVRHELQVLQELEFIDYILLVWTVINYCHENDIPVGLGRGSAAGSLVLYLIGVTGIDPIKYGLYFERFISKVRAKKKIVDGVTYLDGSLMCDIDMDICYYKRPQVIQFLESIFEGKIARIGTLNTLSGKLLIKECGKIIAEKSEAEMIQVAGWIPKRHGVVGDIEEAYHGIESDDESKRAEPVPEFVKWVDENPEIYQIALKLRDLIKNKGVHASGLLVSHAPIRSTVPLELSSDKNYASSFDMQWASLANLKLDLLGLRSVSVVHDVCQAVGIRVEDIDVSDPFIYQQLQDLKTPHGLFQIEAETNLRVCQKVKPKNLDELSGVLALARPGALQFVEAYANYTTTGTCNSLHPVFDEISNQTGGVMLYQEQAMQMANRIGFTLDEAEILRRVIGKKKLDEVKEWREKIYAKVREKNLPIEVADLFWKILDDSASYSFNKCLALDTQVETLDGGYKLLFEVQPGDFVKACDVSKDQDHYVEVLAKHESQAELFEVELEDGRVITCSMKHKLLCEDRVMRPLEEIISHGHKIVCNA